MKEKKKNKVECYTDDDLYKFLILDKNGKLVGVSEDSPKFLKKAFKKYKKINK